MKYKIGTVSDAGGMEVEIWHGDLFGQNKHVAAAYLRATAFLLEKNWAMAPFDLTNNAHKIIWLEKDGECLGGVCYEYHPFNRQGWIVMIFTEDKWRGRHLYTILQNALEDEIVKLGGTSIASMAHKDNEARLKAGAREGMLPQYLRLYKDLGPDLDQRKQRLAQQAGKPFKEISKDYWRLADAVVPKK